MFDVMAYIAFAVLSVAIGGGVIGLGLVMLWLGCAILAWEKTAPEVRD